MKNRFECKRETVLAASLIALAILSAMFFNGGNIYMLSLSWGALLIGFFYQTTQVRTVSFTLNPVIIILLGFVAWMVISLIWHPVVWQGAHFNSRFGLFAAAVIGVYIFAPVVSMRAFFVTFLLIMLGVSILSVYQSVYLETMASGLLVNKNNNAALHLLIILPLMSVLLFGNRSVWVKWVARISLSVVMLGYLFAASRGAHVGLLFSGGGLLYLAIKGRRYNNVASVLTLFCVVLTVYIILPAGVAPKTDLDPAGRWGIWNATVSMLLNTEWYGAGNGMFVFLFPDYWPLEYGGILGNFAHNDYLQILFELGIPGLVLVVALYIVLSMQVVKYISQRNSDSSYAWHLGMYAAISAVSIHSMFTFNLYISSIVLVLGFYTGFLLNKYDYDQDVKRIDVPRAYVFAALLMFVIAGKWVFLSGVANAVSMGDLVVGKHINDMTPQQRRTRYHQLAKMDPSNYLYPMKEALSLASMGKGYSTEDRVEIYTKAMELLEMSISINPYANEPYFAKAEIISDYQDIVGDAWYQEVTSILSRTIARDPNRLPRGRMYLARIYESHGELRRAFALMLEGLSYGSFMHDMEVLEYGKMLSTKAKSRYGEDNFDYWIKRYTCENTVLPAVDTSVACY